MTAGGDRITQKMEGHYQLYLLNLLAHYASLNILVIASVYNNDYLSTSPFEKLTAQTLYCDESCHVQAHLLT